MADKIEGRYPVGWLKDEPDKEAVKAELLAARPILEKLDKILQKKKANVSLGTDPDYMDASWPYKAAALSGYHRALDEVQKLIPKY